MRSKLRLQAPIVVDGILEMPQFLALLKAWSRGEPGQIDHWTVPPPAGVNSVWWQADVPASPDHFPPLETLPGFTTRYREARLSCSGEQISGSERALIQDRLADLDPARAHAAMFSQDYLKLQWGVDNVYALFHAPLAIGMDAIYFSEERELEVRVHYRPPLSPSDFEIRIGTGRFDVSRDPVVPRPAEALDAFGWDMARARFSVEQGSPVKVWLTRVGSSNFGWELTVDVGRPPSPELVRERFIADWYRLGRRDLADEVAPRTIGGAKTDRPADALEVAIANVLGALGFSVLFAGSVLKSAGVDIVAFDLSETVAFVLSVTTGGDIRGKLQTLASIERFMTVPLAAAWGLRYVIITAEPSSALLVGDLEECKRRCKRRNVTVPRRRTWSRCESRRPISSRSRLRCSAPKGFVSLCLPL